MLRRREAKIKKTCTSLFDQLNNRNLIKSSEAEVLRSNFSGMKHSLFKNVLKHSSRLPQGRRYTDEVKEFALALQFYSTKAYNYVRSIISLPHLSMIQKRARSINGEPGFITESFESLSKEVQMSPARRDCCLVLDGMAIRKRVLWDTSKGKYNGFVD